MLEIRTGPQKMTYFKGAICSLNSAAQALGPWGFPSAGLAAPSDDSPAFGSEGADEFQGRRRPGISADSMDFIIKDRDVVGLNHE